MRLRTASHESQRLVPYYSGAGGELVSGAILGGYARYIATRPGAERLGDHGLFGDEGSVDLDKAMSELEHYTGNVWTHIISLHREDAARLGYDNAQAWRSLLRTHRNDIAAAMNIPPQDFRWYAAFHRKEDSVHIHMVVFSSDPKEGYLTRQGIQQVKSAFGRRIFQQDLLHVYEQKTEYRDALAGMRSAPWQS